MCKPGMCSCVRKLTKSLHAWSISLPSVHQQTLRRRVLSHNSVCTGFSVQECVHNIICMHIGM